MDLEKEFRTLKLLAKTLVILGVALILGGLGTAVLTAPPRAATAPPEAAQPAEPGAAPRPDRATELRKMSSFTRDLGVRGAILGAVFVLLGWALNRVIRNTLDDGTFSTMDQELFRAYAEQLAAAEKKKRQKRFKID